MKKTDRGKNFLESERILLLKLCNKYKNIIECKRSDMNFLKDKETAWNRVTRQFNATFVGGSARTTKQLQEKYKNIKKDLRKKHAECKKYVRGTGGGPYIPPPDTKTEEEKELFETIRLSADGVTNEFDADGRYGITGTSPHTINIESVTETQDSVPDDWTSGSSFLWRTPKNPKLSNPKPSVLTSNKNLEKHTQYKLPENIKTSTSTTLTEKETPSSFPDPDFNYFNHLENISGSTDLEQEIEKQGKLTENENNVMNRNFIEKEAPSSFLDFDLSDHCNSSDNAEQELDVQNKDGENMENDSNGNKASPISRYVGSTNRRRPIIKRKKMTVTSAGGKFELAAKKKISLIEHEMLVSNIKLKQIQEEHRI